MGRKTFGTNDKKSMKDYDEECALEFALLRKNIEKYFIDITVDCPYDLPHHATFYQAMFGPISERTMELFLAAGYRRNGNCLYAMNCTECSSCVPIRLYPSLHQPNRNQRRVWRKNQDLSISLGVISPNIEKLEVCEKFLKARYPYAGNTAEKYYSGFFLNKIVTTFEINYHLGDRLIGSAIIDMGYNWLNAVYFFFDPAEEKRSLGTYNILTLVDFCRRKNIEYLYLGYYIEDVSSMNYKQKFKPNYLYIDSHWQQYM